MKVQAPLQAKGVKKTYLPEANPMHLKVAESTCAKASFQKNSHFKEYNLRDLLAPRNSFKSEQTSNLRKNIHQPNRQEKITISEPDNKYEKEAKRVAQKIVKRINASEAVQNSLAGVSKQKMTSPNEVKTIQLEPLNNNTTNQENITFKAPGLKNLMQMAQKTGQQIPTSIRTSMEKAFGRDFRQVRIHTDNQADHLNKIMNAKAFTTGHNIFFSQGSFNPNRHAGRVLIAHELAHTIQQANVSDYKNSTNHVSSQHSEIEQDITIQREIGYDYERDAYYETDQDSEDIPTSKALWFTSQYDGIYPIYVDKNGATKLLTELSERNKPKSTDPEQENPGSKALENITKNRVSRKKKSDPYYRPISRRDTRSRKYDKKAQEDNKFLVEGIRKLLFYTDEGEYDVATLEDEKVKSFGEQVLQSVQDQKKVPEGGSVFSARYPLPNEGAILIVKKSEVGNKDDEMKDDEMKDSGGVQDDEMKDDEMKDSGGVQDDEMKDDRLRKLIEILGEAEKRNIEIKKLEDKDFEEAYSRYKEPFAVKGENYIYLSGGEDLNKTIQNPRREKSVYKRSQRESLKNSSEWIKAEKPDLVSNPLPVYKGKSPNVWYDHKARLTTRGRGKGQEHAMNNWNALAYARYIYEKNLNVPLAEKMHQDWEWLHIKGAQLGGETKNENLVAGTSTTNSRMIPVENRIKKLSHLASPKHPLSLKFEAECEGKTHLGKKIKVSVAAENGLESDVKEEESVPKISKARPVVYEFYPQDGQLFDRFSELLSRKYIRPENEYKE